MKKQEKYAMAVWVLSTIVIMQWVLLIMVTRPAKIPEAAPAPISAGIKGRIAIVIDDWGYHLDTLALLDNLKYPMTMAVLPRLHYSQAVAEGLHQRGFEIILHLPLEPHEKIRLEQDTIMTGFSAEKIKSILDKDLDNIRYVKGVSNHMGSAATENGSTMEVIFRDLKSRQLYFLDSLASSKSICSELAQDIGIAFVKRDIFLDNKSDADYIKGQVYKLKMKAKFSGKAIGIGHDRKKTLEVLKEAMPQLAAEGYKFVFVSDLVE